MSVPYLELSLNKLAISTAYIECCICAHYKEWQDHFPDQKFIALVLTGNANLSSLLISSDRWLDEDPLVPFNNR